MFSAVLIVWAKTRPGFDPYGWLVWGHQTLHGTLDTNAAPSWKPLPYLFTVPYALFGHYQLWLWMITSVAISLSGVVFAGRIAYKLTDAPPERPLGRLRGAAAFAGLALLGISDYLHYMLSAQSDPMIVALCLAAIDCHLRGRPRWAFALGACSPRSGGPRCGRSWACYAIWAWLARAADAPGAGGGRGGRGAAVVRDPGAHLAHAVRGRQPTRSAPGARLTATRSTGTISRFLGLHEPAGAAAALLAVGARGAAPATA